MLVPKREKCLYSLIYIQKTVSKETRRKDAVTLHFLSELNGYRLNPCGEPQPVGEDKF